MVGQRQGLRLPQAARRSARSRRDVLAEPCRAACEPCGDRSPDRLPTAAGDGMAASPRSSRRTGLTASSRSTRPTKPGASLVRHRSEDNGERHHVYPDPRGLVVPIHRHRPLLPARRRLVHATPDDDGARPTGAAHGHLAQEAEGHDPGSLGPRQPVLQPRMADLPVAAQPRSKHEPPRELPR